MAGDAAFEFEEASIEELQASMASGSLTSRGLTEAYLERIEMVDAALRSVLETNPDALEIADTLDAERRSGRVRGALHGVPVLVKDNVDTADRMKTTAGSFALGEVTPASDAFLVARLREAGAVILGKANLSEWANFRSTRSSSGWSARGGQCVNPYDADRSPCGSSSGSGVAVSANLSAVAVGTETDGSIVCPSSVNGIVGIKPTVGLVSRSGVVPVSHSQDTPGPMARMVADAAALLAALAGADPRDAATARARVGADYAAFLDPDGLRDARIGVARKLAGFNDRVDRLFDEALGAMRELGAEIVDPADIPHTDELEDPELEVFLYEFKADLEAYLGSYGLTQPHRAIADLIAFNAEHADAEMPFFGQELFEQAAAKGPLTEPAYLEALATCQRLSRAEGIDAVMDEHRLDALVAPSNAPAWRIDHANGDHYVGGNSTPAAVAGYPNVTVPMGFAFDLPIGVSFIGRAWSEGTLIRLASAFERATRHRRAPGLATAPEPAHNLGDA
ncbi:MAG TPA: amidase [Actinomycetota bacterium]|nr:amidase [Actinomycetota bacterium]